MSSDRSRSIPLDRLLAGLTQLSCRGPAATTLVRGVSYDSRTVGPGDLFVALPGSRFDGHEFLEQACRQGAAALLVERPATQAPPGPAVVQVADTRAALAAVARVFFADPSRRLRVAGVTGTNGKTTFCFLLEALLTAAGRRAGLIGTLGMRCGELVRPTKNTTPESLDLQRLLDELAAAGATDVALEVSSHALASHRVDGLTCAVRVFTNLSRDHLDLHGSEEAYYQAKRRLFLDFPAAPSWTNLDDPWGARLAREVPGCLGYSAAGRPDAALRVLHAGQGPDGLQATVAGPDGVVLTLRSPLVGRFNLENLLAVAAAGLSLGLDPGAIARGLAGAAGAPGRLQRVPDPAGRLELYVDYAHTPDALARVLAELARRAKERGGRVITVFGCGGERDAGKRPEMGAAAAAHSGLLVITDDNPRGEDGARIIEAIQAGVPAGTPVRVEPDRARAIALAVAVAAAEDVILVAGKGHETYQERAGVRYPFSDVEQAGLALARRGSIR